MKEILNDIEQITTLATKLGRKVKISELEQYFDNVNIIDAGVHPGQGLIIQGKKYRSDNRAFFQMGKRMLAVFHISQIQQTFCNLWVKKTCQQKQVLIIQY